MTLLANDQTRDFGGLVQNKHRNFFGFHAFTCNIAHAMHTPL